MYSDGTVSALGVAVTALRVGLTDVLVDRTVSDFSLVADVLDDRTIVDVAVAWTIVLVIVVVEASKTVVSCAKTEGVRMTASVARVIAKRIVKESKAQSDEAGTDYGYSADIGGAAGGERKRVQEV